MAKEEDAIPGKEEDQMMKILDYMNATAAPPFWKRLRNAEIFDYDAVAKITNNFNEESIIGRGTFGGVYMGRLDTGQIVAVKNVDVANPQGDRKFLMQIMMLTLLRHPNIINLIGFSFERTHRFLVYEYMPLGSLDNHLHGPQANLNPLDWKTRVAIAAGIARGLNYLHNEVRPPVIFHNLKTANILLDQSFNPRLCDFEHANSGPTIVPVEGYHATEECYDNAVKGDVYKFGYVLFELITGRKREEIIQAHGILPSEWLHPMKRDRKKLYDEAVDPRLNGKYEKYSLCVAVDVALACLDEQGLILPNMKDVAKAMYSMERACRRTVGN